MSAEDVPLFVEDGERLIRECSSGHIRPDGSVKHQAFVATKEPLQISCHRDEYCNEWSGCNRDRSRTAVAVIAGEARQVQSRPDVRSDSPPADHALICVADAPAVKTKGELFIEANAALFAKHSALCRELASIATLCRRLTPPGVII